MRKEVTVKGARMKAFRSMKVPSWSQAKLAAEATDRLRKMTGDPERSISESLVALIETDRRQPSRENAEAFALALGVEFEALADLNVPEAVAQ